MWKLFLSPICIYNWRFREISFLFLNTRLMFSLRFYDPFFDDIVNNCWAMQVFIEINSLAPVPIASMGPYAILQYNGWISQEFPCRSISTYPPIKLYQICIYPLTNYRIFYIIMFKFLFEMVFNQLSEIVWKLWNYPINKTQISIF